MEPGSAIALGELAVSIPERVWWFVERISPVRFSIKAEFQSLKGFGGLWNTLTFTQPQAIIHLLFQSLKGFGGLWNLTQPTVFYYSIAFQSLKGFGGLWNSS